MSEVKEKLEGIETSYGTCKYCGQVHHMQTTGQCTEETGKNNIEKLFRENYPEAADILRYGTAAVVQNIIAGITVDAGHGIKGKVTLTGKGKVKVEMIVNRKTSLEE